MRKVIALSIYGADPKYCIGAAKNVWLAKAWYPGWQVIVWADQSVPSKVTDYLLGAGAEVMDASSFDTGGEFWRFLVADLPDVERYIIRDADSRIGEREARAVAQWIESGKSFHVMRDHPHHHDVVMGGMWGAKGGLIKDMAGLIRKFGTHICDPKTVYACDQQFIRHMIWDDVKNDCLQHDSCLAHLYPGSVPFPTQLSYDSPRFVGEVFDEFDEPRPYEWEKIYNHIT